MIFYALVVNGKFATDLLYYRLILGNSEKQQQQKNNYNTVCEITLFYKKTVFAIGF